MQDWENKEKRRKAKDKSTKRKKEKKVKASKITYPFSLIHIPVILNIKKNG